MGSASHAALAKAGVEARSSPCRLMQKGANGYSTNVLLFRKPFAISVPHHPRCCACVVFAPVRPSHPLADVQGQTDVSPYENQSITVSERSAFGDTWYLQDDLAPERVVCGGAGAW